MVSGETLCRDTCQLIGIIGNIAINRDKSAGQEKLQYFVTYKAILLEHLPFTLFNLYLKIQS